MVKNIVLNTLKQAIKTGETSRTFIKTINNELEKNNQTIDNMVLESLYQSYISYYYTHIHYNQMTDNVDDRPYWQYISFLAPTTSPFHAALHGKTFRFDDPFWNTHYPPNDWGCKCRVRALDQDDIEYKKLKVETSEGLLKIETINTHKIPVFNDTKTGLKIYPNENWCFNISKKPFREVEEMILNYYFKKIIWFK